MTTGDPLICTYTNSYWVNGSVAANRTVDMCDCTGDAAYEWYGVSALCTVYCDPPPYPILVGAVMTDCIIASGCYYSMGRGFHDYAELSAALVAPIFGVDNHVFDAGLSCAPPASPDFYQSFLTSYLNIYYFRRYNPTQYIYFRTLDDPQYSKDDCIPNDTDRAFWAGLNVETAFTLLNRTYFGTFTGANDTCRFYYVSNTPEYILCLRFRQTYPFLAGTDWGAQFATRLRVVLNLLQAYRFNCTVNTFGSCFVWTKFYGSQIGTSLPGSLFVPGPENLPPLIFTVPEYDPSFLMSNANN